MADIADALEDDFVTSDVDSTIDASQREADQDREEAWRSRERKRGKLVDFEEGDGQEKEEKQQGEDGVKKANKKRKRKEQEKLRKAKKAKDDLALPPLAQRPPDIQADHLRKLLTSCKAFSKLSEFEVDEMSIAENMLVDSTSVTVKRSLELFPRFLEVALPETIETLASVSPTNIQPGQIVVLIVTGNAQRAADLARPLRELSPSQSIECKEQIQGDAEKKEKRAPVAKLFARHFKLSEQQAFLSSYISPAAVGTPQRLVDLIHSGSLKLDQLNAIVLDASWTDQKMRTMLEGPETREAVFRLLNHTSLRAQLSANRRPSVLLF